MYERNEWIKRTVLFGAGTLVGALLTIGGYSCSSNSPDPKTDNSVPSSRPTSITLLRDVDGDSIPDLSLGLTDNPDYKHLLLGHIDEKGNTEYIGIPKVLERYEGLEKRLNSGELSQMLPPPRKDPPSSSYSPQQGPNQGSNQQEDYTTPNLKGPNQTSDSVPSSSNYADSNRDIYSPGPTLKPRPLVQINRD
jgi:hypothetical protein